MCDLILCRMQCIAALAHAGDMSGLRAGMRLYAKYGAVTSGHTASLMHPIRSLLMLELVEAWGMLVSK